MCWFLSCPVSEEMPRMYEEFSKLTPNDAVPVDREGLLQKLGVRMKLEELIAEMAEV